MDSLSLLVALLTAAPFILGYWIWRAVARVRVGKRLREPRAWQASGLGGAAAEWLVPEWPPERLPEAFSLVDVACEWAAVDPDVVRDWGFRRLPPLEGASLEALLASLWEGTPPAARKRAEALLRAELARMESAWSDAPRGWGGRPYVVPGPLVKRQKKDDLRVQVVPDLTSAPAPGPLRAMEAASGAPAWQLPFLIALQRRAPVERLHPLANAAAGVPGLGAVGDRVGTDVGRQVGARVGGMFGPLGSLLGQHVGGMLGAAGARNLASRAERSLAAARVEEAETALTILGALSENRDFKEAARQPETRWLALGTEWESQRGRRRVPISERFWPGAAAALPEECLRAALGELKAYRLTGPLFEAYLRQAPPAVRGGVLLQNPWLAARLPEGPAAVSEARKALNRAAQAIRAENEGR